MDQVIVRLNQMEAAMLRAAGWNFERCERRGPQYVAIAIKGTERAEAAGKSPDGAVRNVITLLVRR
jgi:hypothetical protein